MKKYSLLVFLIVLNISKLYSQKETYIGIGGLFASCDLYTFSDDGSLIKDVDYGYYRIDGPELFIGRQISKQMFIELAYKKKIYYIGFENNSEFGRLASYSNALNTYQIPVRLKYRQKIMRDITLNPYIGFIFGINESYSVKREATGGDKNLTVNSKYLTNYRKTFVLAHMGFDLEFSLNNKHSILLNFGYAKGFNDLVIQRIDYSIEGEPWVLAKIVGMGDYMSCGVSYKYRFNNNQL